MFYTPAPVIARPSAHSHSPATSIYNSSLYLMPELGVLRIWVHDADAAEASRGTEGHKEAEARSWSNSGKCSQLTRECPAEGGSSNRGVCLDRHRVQLLVCSACTTVHGQRSRFGSPMFSTCALVVAFPSARLRPFIASTNGACIYLGSKPGRV